MRHCASVKRSVFDGTRRSGAEKEERGLYSLAGGVSTDDTPPIWGIPEGDALNMAMTERQERLEYELEPKLQRELLKHPGKWAAVTRSRLLAVGKTPKAALRAAKRAHPHASPILHHIPDTRHTAYFF